MENETAEHKNRNAHRLGRGFYDPSTVLSGVAHLGAVVMGERKISACAACVALSAKSSIPIGERTSDGTWTARVGSAPTAPKISLAMRQARVLQWVTKPRRSCAKPAKDIDELGRTYCPAASLRRYRLYCGRGWV
jgi:hypothetical protein